MPTEVATLCFHTRDAVERTEGSFTFRMPSHGLRNHATKVALASCEFPIVQQTVEPMWNRLYYSESIRLTKENNFLVVVLRATSNDKETVYHLRLPPHRNEASVVCDRSGRSITVKTMDPHHLFGEDHKAFSVPAKLTLASASGDVDLDDIEYIDSRTFRVKGNRLDASGSGVVVCDSVPSPLALASLLTEAAQRTDLPLAFRYEDKRDCIQPTVGRTGPDSFVRILPSVLSAFCGFSTVMHRGMGDMPCESGRWFDYIEIPTGFYSPCHRPMCIGQPLPLGPVLELSLNRYYFPLLGSGGNGPSNHVIVFANPDGGIHTCVIPAGRYGKESLADHLQNEMTKSAEEAMEPGTVQYSVHVTDLDVWSFSCERLIRGEWREAVFSILFHHPMSVEPQRFGFSAQPMNGCSSYTSSKSLRSIPTIRNLLRYGEDGPRKRFRAHAATIPSMVGVVTDSQTVDGRFGLITYQTYVNKKSYASGLRGGDTVRITTFSGTTMDDEKVASETPVSFPGVFTCLVESSTVASTILRVPLCLHERLRVRGTSVQILADVEPWNLHFGKPGCLPSHMLGWKAEGVLWGRDGSSAGYPPYEAPHIHSLDHPDYICLTFSEMGGAGLEHTYDDVTRPIFCKLSLYPLFREERMLPRDTQLMQNNMASFTLSFWNPDMTTPYCFHGAEFSFSLAFFSGVPDA